MTPLFILSLVFYALVVVWRSRELVRGLRERKELLKHRVLTNRGWIDREEAELEEVKL